MIDSGALHAIMPRAGASWVEPLNDAMVAFSIDQTFARQAAFLAQIADESTELTRGYENLTYSAERLLAVFPGRFSPSLAAEYANRPETIANYVYGGRNGNTAPGDGWLYRGRGAGGLTFKCNYEAAGLALDKDLVGNPDLVATDPYCYVGSFAWFWRVHNLSLLADAGDFDGITRITNGGTNDSAQRRAYWKVAKVTLGLT